MPKTTFAEALDGDDENRQTNEGGPVTDDETPETPETPEGETREETQVEEREDTRVGRSEDGERTEADDTPDARDTPEQARHKRTSRERRDARKRYQQSLRAENQQLHGEVQSLMQRLAAVETGQGDSRLALLDSDLKRCSDELATADRVYENALKAAGAGVEGAAGDVVQATRLREEARDRQRQLQFDRQRLTDALTQARNQPTPTLRAPGSAQADRLEAQFRADRPWLQFDRQGAPLNIESGVARTIGVAMRAQGLDSSKPAYWAEMDRRLRGALPQMFDDDVTEDEGHDDEDETGDDEQQGERGNTQQQGRQQPTNRDRGPPVGRSGRNSGANRNTAVIPKEIVEALKEAGMWDDPKERKEALAYYRAAGTIK